jgi:L-ascorbate metabolism protein UlaG (beta-lactamase superfamily)
LHSKIFQKARALKKQLSRRRFLFLGGAGVAGGVLSMQATQHLSSRFFRERFAELAKPCVPANHKPAVGDWDANAITASWLGHATVLINFYGLNIITDPVLFSRVGASFGLGTIGPMRRQACALKSKELPKIDLALLSHAHLDHFDIRSLNALPGQPQAVTAKNTSDLFRETQISTLTELAWGEKSLIHTANGDVEIEAFRVRHWGARWRHDKHRGYNGYIINREGKKIIFGGDTALCNGFKEIRGKGPFEFACMPIGAYNPYITSHCNPEQAWRMTQDAGAKYILPMHHFTFRFGRELCTEPIQRLKTAMNGEVGRLAFKEAGETFVVKA